MVATLTSDLEKTKVRAYHQVHHHQLYESVSDCNCHQNDTDLVAANREKPVIVSSRRPDLFPDAVRQFTGAVVTKQMSLNYKGQFMTMASEVTSAFRLEYGGNWCCIVGRKHRFDFHCLSEEDLVIEAKAGAIDFKIFRPKNST